MKDVEICQESGVPGLLLDRGKPLVSKRSPEEFVRRKEGVIETIGLYLHLLLPEERGITVKVCNIEGGAVYGERLQDWSLRWWSDVTGKKSISTVKQPQYVVLNDDLNEVNKLLRLLNNLKWRSK